MTPVFKKMFKSYGIGLVWFFALLWPLLGIHADGSITFKNAIMVWLYVFGASLIILAFMLLKRAGLLSFMTAPLSRVSQTTRLSAQTMPKWIWISLGMALLLLFPQFTGRYETDVAINVLVYICLGLGTEHRGGAGGHVGPGIHRLLRSGGLYLCPVEHSLPALLLAGPAGGGLNRLRGRLHHRLPDPAYAR